MISDVWRPASYWSLHCPSLKSTLSRPKQGFNCQGQLMRATSAPSNLQGQRQPVINCCVHKCKWVHWGSRGRRKKRLSGQYSSGEQSAREGNDLEDSAQICCSVKYEEARCERRLVEMEEVAVRTKKNKKMIEKNCGGNKYQLFYSNLLLPHMSTICIHKRNQAFVRTLPSHTRLTCDIVVAYFHKNECTYFIL